MEINLNNPKKYQILQGDNREILKSLPDDSIDMVVTSPPYYALRNYKAGEKEIGREPTPFEYVAALRDVFHEVKRVLKPTGTLWLNLGDTYNGNKQGNTKTNKNNRVSEEQEGLNKSEWKDLPPKSLMGIPWRVAFALQDDGWVLRSDIIWCLSGNTEVIAKVNGKRKNVAIKDLTLDDELWGIGKWTKIKSIIRNPIHGERRGIMLESGETISCTTEHRFPVIRVSDVYNYSEEVLLEARDIKVGDIIKAYVPNRQGLEDEDCYLFSTQNRVVGFTEPDEGDYYDVEVEDEPHLFALASGVLTHNCKPNPMPQSCTDRVTCAHEYIFMFSKQPSGYYFDYEAIEEPANYDGRKDTEMHGSTKYKDADYLANGKPNSFTAGGHQRWKFKTRNADGELVDVDPSMGGEEQDVSEALQHNLFDFEDGQGKAIDISPKSSGIKFGGNKYPNSDSGAAATYSGHEWTPKYKNLQAEEKGQTNHSFHERRAQGLPDEIYAVRRKRDVWVIPTKGYSGAHFATFPEKLVEPCILAGCPKGGLVLDPFNGAATTGVVACKHHRRYLGIELNPDFVKLSLERLQTETAQGTLDFPDMAW